MQPTFELLPDELRIRNELGHLTPDLLVEKVLPDRSVVTDAPVLEAIVIAAQASIVVELGFLGAGRRPVVGVAAVSAADQPL